MNSLRDEIEQMLNPFLMRYQAEVLSKLITEKIEKKLDERIDRLLKIKEPVPAQILLKCAGLEEAKMLLTNDKDKK